VGRSSRLPKDATLSGRCRCHYQGPNTSDNFSEVKLRARRLDGELVVCNDSGVSSFERLRSRQHDHLAFLCAFDLLQGDDLRREPLETRKATLASLLRKSEMGIDICEHAEADGELVFRHACKKGLDGIVSKRRDSRYSSGTTPNWSRARTRSHRPCTVRPRRTGTSDAQA
jgi:ATP-dependent DNA ligase